MISPEREKNGTLGGTHKQMKVRKFLPHTPCFCPTRPVFAPHALFFAPHALFFAPHALKGQKLLAQGSALGIIAIGKAPCKGKSLINLPGT